MTDWQFRATVFPFVNQATGQQVDLTAASFEEPLQVKHKSEAPLWSAAVFASDKRALANVLGVHALVYDIDDTLTDAELPEFLSRAESLGLCYVHNTWGSAPDAWKLRVVYPLAEPVSRITFDDMWAAYAKELGRADWHARDSSRMFFVPIKPHAQDYQYWRFYTQPLIAPNPSLQAEFDNWLGKIRNAQDGERYNLVNSCGIALAKLIYVTPQAFFDVSWTDVEDALIASGTQSLDKHRERYRSALQYGESLVQQQRFLDDRAKSAKQAVQAEEAANSDWFEQLITTMRKDRIVVLPTSQNLQILFRTHPEFVTNLVVRNVRKAGEAPLFTRKPPWEEDDDTVVYPRKIHAGDLGSMLLWLSVIGFDLGAFSTAALESEFYKWVDVCPEIDFFAEWIDSIPVEYEQGDQLQELFSRGFNKRQTRYLSEVSITTLAKAVWKAWHPGSKDDAITVLQGEEDLGKTYLWTLLFDGVDAYDKDSWTQEIASMSDKDVYFKLTQCVFGVDDEMKSSRRDRAAHKHFISNANPVMRAPYARFAAPLPRRCALISTTNEDAFIDDATGARRFNVVDVEHKLDQDWVRENVLYFWAQARKQARLRKGNFTLSTPATLEQAALVKQFALDSVGMSDTVEALLERVHPMNGDFREGMEPQAHGQLFDFPTIVRDPGAQVVIKLYTGQLDKNRQLIFVTGRQVAAALRRDGDNRKVQTDVGAALRRLKWKPTQRWVDGHNVRVYVRPTKKGSTNGSGSSQSSVKSPGGSGRSSGVAVDSAAQRSNDSVPDNRQGSQGGSQGEGQAAEE